MQKNCKNCSQDFEITTEDKKFYDKFGVPDPEICHDCRAQARMAFRNERNLYQRKCDLTGKPMITTYGNEVSFPVYDHEAWHSDKWDPLKYGIDFDFSKSFFEQFKKLYDTVPRLNLLNQTSENSDYCNYAYRNKNCYLIFGSHYNEDCLHSTYCCECTSSLENLNVFTSELVYGGFYSTKCYNCVFIEYCFNCNDCFFCYDLVGCKNCLFSSNLRNKEYYIFNKQVSKEEFQKALEELNLGDHRSLQEAKNKYSKMKQESIHRATFQINAENCLGHNIQNSKNIYGGFNCGNAEDCRYLIGGVADNLKDCMDVSFIGYDLSEVLYFCVNNSGNNTALCCVSCWHSSNINYCELCLDSQNLFGCIGLKNKKFCILNKQYSKEKYEELLPKIIKHMASSGEYGKFFPMQLSQFPYNESVAYHYYPLTKEEALSKGLKWKDPDKKEYKKQSYKVSNDIKDVSEDILEHILACENCGKNYKIIPLELKLYQKFKLALPLDCPDCRHIERLKLYNPQKLWSRECSNCKKEIQSTYSPERPEIVYCEECYMKKVY